MKGIKENDLKRIFGEVMFNEFITYMKGRTYANMDNEPLYYSTNIDDYMCDYFSNHMYQLCVRELEKVEIEV